MGKMKTYLIFGLLALCGSLVNADQIYKSIDKDGRVSYSSEPEGNAVKVEKIAPPPAIDPSEKQRAEQRFQELEERDAARQKEQRENEILELQRQQLQADLELRRRLANPKPANVIVINQNPYYWGRGYRPRWRKPIKSKPVQPKPEVMPRKLPGPTGTPLYH